MSCSAPKMTGCWAPAALFLAIRRPLPNDAEYCVVLMSLLLVGDGSGYVFDERRFLIDTDGCAACDRRAVIVLRVPSLDGRDDALDVGLDHCLGLVHIVFDVRRDAFHFGRCFECVGHVRT